MPYPLRRALECLRYAIFVVYVKGAILKKFIKIHCPAWVVFINTFVKQKSEINFRSVT